ncbi:unnamed protein product [Vitrella brassicaformis CCMP3155]|uniref:ATPase AAA-type core domain-containing protein n=1 Tax=Vitrella brassicaformis (strain CCMP3155) TaxID=1169540 RepID=A0A0G4F4N5_VITBC|nr:unnamed protein product [Vitrella brassicaformis CCMP3155]|eukprot:CEM06887.1 unnamed protein product [Vitrella brassicaformis CCMP3155]
MRMSQEGALRVTPDGLVPLKDLNKLSLEKQSLREQSTSPLPELVPSINLGSLDPTYFIGDKDLDEVVSDIMRCYKEDDSILASSDRIPPMSLTRHPRGGKTRFLKEIGRRLRDKQKVPSIRIAFNDRTGKQDVEETLSLKQRLLKRIGWSVATDETRSLVGNNFKRWMETVDVPESTIEEWLGDGGCVLLIDEMNKLITDAIRGGTEETDLAAFLKCYFIDKANRYLVLSSHTTTTGDKLSTFITSPSDRDVIRPRLPVITSPEEVEKLGVDAINEGALCLVMSAMP